MMQSITLQERFFEKCVRSNKRLVFITNRIEWNDDFDVDFDNEIVDIVIFSIVDVNSEDGEV